VGTPSTLRNDQLLSSCN